MSNHELVVKLVIVAVCLCAGAIVLVALARFAKWLVQALYAQALQLIEALTMGLIKVACVFAGLLYRAVCGLAHIVWSLLASAAMAATLPVKVQADRIGSAISENTKLRQLYWKYGHTEFDSFSAFKRHMRGETPQDEPTPSPPRESSFSDAQAVLGFGADEPLTATDLKLRFQKMIRLVHSDTGFPNTVFAQQLTEAVRVIKKVRKWK